MSARQVRDFLFPHAAERDPAFAEEVRHQSRRALRLVALAEIGVPLTALLIQILLNAGWAERPPQAVVTFITVAAGLLTLAAGRTRWGRRQPLPMVVTSVFAIATILTGVEVWTAHTAIDLERDVPLILSVAVFVLVATLPAQPWQVLAFTAGNMAVYYGGAAWAAETGRISGALHESQYVWLPTVSLCAVVLAAANYRRVHRSFLFHRAALRAAEDARRAETRALMAETTAALGRLTAAVSHELNTPIGALHGSVETLVPALERLETASPDERRRLAALIRELAAVIAEAATRLTHTVRRMQRFTNLDRAEVRPVDVNRLVEDVVNLAPAAAESGIRIHRRLQPCGELMANAQLLGAALSAVLEDSLSAARPGDQIDLETSSPSPNTAGITIINPGRQAPPAGIASLFDPDFHVENGRVTAGNWNLFAARQMIREAGGDLAIDAPPGGGLRIAIRLRSIPEPPPGAPASTAGAA